MKPYDEWTFKCKLESFKSASRSDMSPFFWYNGYGGRQYKLFPNHKPGLLRFDDPGNMCYAASGKTVMSVFDSTFEKYLLKWAAETIALPNGLSNFWKPIYTQLEDGPTRQIFDDPWDMKAIEGAYDTPFVQSDEFVPFKTFEFYCKRFGLAPK